MSTFLNLPVTALDSASSGDIVILGACDATPYETNKPSHARTAPAVLRHASQRYGSWHDHIDFDTGEVMVSARNRVVDAGDITTAPDTPGENRRKIEASVRQVLQSGATPVVLGGDDLVPIPVLAAYERHGPIWIVQVDAHIDWRDQRSGERMGWSSPMRRASEMPWVAGIVQVGARGVGSARPEDLRAARQWGAEIVTARHVHTEGITSAISKLPAGACSFVTLDCDALEPSCMPAVAAPVPGGLDYWQVVGLMDGIASRSWIVGFDIVEFAPDLDVGGISALTSVRLVTHAINAIAASRVVG